MNTTCPQCRTVFRLDAGILERADGRVRCGTCNHVFNARGHLQGELPLAAATEEIESLDEVEAAAGARGVLRSDLENGTNTIPGRRRPTRRSVAFWGMLNTLLLLLFCAQLLLAQRAAFAHDPTLRPVVARLCGVVGCKLAPQSAPGRIRLLRRQVYTHPNVAHALIIETRFVNDAPFAQAYPVLTVTLATANGEPVVRRNLRPRDYLPDLPAHARMTPGKPVNVTLQVRDPGRKARTFEIDFFAPHS